MNKTVKYIIGAITAVIAVLLLWYFRNIVLYIIVAAVLSVIGRPLVRAFKKVRIKKLGIPDWLAALMSLLSMYLVAVTFFYIFIPLIFSKMSALATIDWQGLFYNFHEPLARFENFLDEYFSIKMSSETITEAISRSFSGFAGIDAINSFVSSLVSVVAGTVIAIFSITFIAFFFLKDDNLFLNILLAVSPSKYESNIRHALNSANRLLARYFIGILCESTIMMLIVAISLICCGYGVSNAFFIGIIVGILNVIPYVGPWLGFGISLLVSMAFITTGTSFTFIFLSLGITILAAQMIDNFILQPLLYSNSVNAHPLEIFIVILMAGSVGGVLGMVVAIPTYTVLRVIAREFFANFKIVQKLTENLEN